jgi:hypothetical protein
VDDAQAFYDSMAEDIAYMQQQEKAEQQAGVNFLDLFAEEMQQ